MLGKQVVKKYPYVLLGVRKDGVYHCAIYTHSEGEPERITTIQSGEVFTDLRKFVENVQQRENCYEWCDCHYYDEDLREWYPMQYMLPRRSFL